MVSVRGEGLLLAAVLGRRLRRPPRCAEALEAGLVVNAPRPDVLRLAPSLLVTDAEIDRALGRLVGRILARLVAASGSRHPRRPEDGRDDP